MSSSGDDKGLPNVYIAGIAVVCAIVAGVGVWLSIRLYKKRKNRQNQLSARIDVRNSAVLDGNGRNRDPEKLDPGSSSHAPRAKFTRKTMDGVVMPAPLKTKDDILAYHRATGTLTHAFTLSVASSATQVSGNVRPSPLGPALPAPTAVHTVARGMAAGRVRPGSSLNPDHARISRASFNAGFTLGPATPGSGSGSSSRPVSIISWCPPSPLGSTFAGAQSHSRGGSGASSLSSFAAPTGIERAVRNTFAPVLPDELLVRVGERLTVVQTLDDGWCVVGRAGAAPAPAPRAGVFGQSATPDGVEMGVVPSWVFERRPAPRPMRTTSLGVTVQVPAPVGVREEVMSWSNF